MSARLLREYFLPYFANPALDPAGDAAVVAVNARDIAISTDTYVVSPLEFPGGDIGSLAVHGTLNDLATMGASPCYFSAGFVLEEGLQLEVLERVVRSMAASAKRAGVALVSGDTKVVEWGKGDGLFVNTTGIGLLDADFRPAPGRARPGDVVLVSGPLGCHGIAILAVREDLGLDAPVLSDSANLFPLVERLRNSVGSDVHVLRHPTRGGLASALTEIARASQIGIDLDEPALPIPAQVAVACELLELDPLSVANEGILVAVVAERAVDEALRILHRHPLGREAARIGQVVRRHPGLVILNAARGGTRLVDLLPGDRLPRLC